MTLTEVRREEASMLDAMKISGGTTSCKVRLQKVHRGLFDQSEFRLHADETTSLYAAQGSTFQTMLNCYVNNST
jgi:hypothetical protein